ncbi:uncharacterized [Tachysurus ichikawai]
MNADLSQLLNFSCQFSLIWWPFDDRLVGEFGHERSTRCTASPFQPLSRLSEEKRPSSVSRVARCRSEIMWMTVFTGAIKGLPVVRSKGWASSCYG